MLGRLVDQFKRKIQFVVEEAADRDLSHLAAIHGEAFSRGWSDGEFARMISNTNYLCLVAREVGRAEKPPLAFILLRMAADEAEIISVATQSSSRRGGLASQLVSTAIRKLQSDRVQHLFLEVDETNSGAIALYKKLGFEQVAERKGYYQSDDAKRSSSAAALVMRRDLG